LYRINLIILLTHLVHSACLYLAMQCSYCCWPTSAQLLLVSCSVQTREPMFSDPGQLVTKWSRLFVERKGWSFCVGDAVVGRYLRTHARTHTPFVTLLCIPYGAGIIYLIKRLGVFCSTRRTENEIRTIMRGEFVHSKIRCPVSGIQYPVSSVCALWSYRPAKLLLERGERQCSWGTVALSKQQHQLRSTVYWGKNINIAIYSNVVGSHAMLQPGRSRVRIPMRSMIFL
jgi:hypothetical protein